MPLLSSASVADEKPLALSTGGEKGTYFRLMKELSQVCPGQFDNVVSSGALENLSRVLGNTAEGGVTQLDALFLRGQKEEDVRKRIRVLAVLHPEEIHFVTKSAPRTEGGIAGFGAKQVYLNSISDLRGRRVGYWGGSAVTEQVIASLALIGWEPVEFNDQATALGALQRDAIDVILAVGGQPLGWVAELTKEYKLLEVPDQVASRLQAVYDKTTLSYRNLGQDGVPALSVPALLVTRNYASPKMVARLQKLRQCLVDAVPELRETRDTHPKWSDIDPTATTAKWSMFEPLTAAGK
jgi:TRAP-type uncharacterized transport system substrate-binding protein